MITKEILGVEQEEQRATRELYSQSSPQQLVASVLQGDPDAFGAIAEQFGTYMLHMARLIVGDYESAQDVLQEALIRAWRYLPDLHEAGALHSWLMRIVVNQSLHLKRQQVNSTALSHRIVDEYKWDAVVQFSDETKGSREQHWDLKQAVRAVARQAAGHRRLALLLWDDLSRNGPGHGNVTKHAEKAPPGGAHQFAT